MVGVTSEQFEKCQDIVSGWPWFLVACPAVNVVGVCLCGHIFSTSSLVFCELSDLEWALTLQDVFACIDCMIYVFQENLWLFVLTLSMNSYDISILLLWFLESIQVVFVCFTTCRLLRSYAVFLMCITRWGSSTQSLHSSLLSMWLPLLVCKVVTLHFVNVMMYM